MRFDFCAILLVLTAGCSVSSTSPNTSLCEVREREKDFHQKRVVVRVNIDGDGELAVVSDPNCPRLGAQLEYSQEALLHGEADPMNEAIRDKLFKNPQITISATLTGTFSIDESNGRGAELIVDRVDDFKIEKGASP